MNDWLRLCLSNQGVDDRLQVIQSAQTGHDFLDAIHQELGGSVASVIAQNCGEWATEYLAPKIKDSHAKNLLIDLVDGGFKGFYDKLHGRHMLYEPCVFALSNGIKVLSCEGTWDSLVDEQWLHCEFRPPSDIWSVTQKAGDKWLEGHSLAGVSSFTNFESAINTQLNSDIRFGSILKEKMKKVQAKRHQLFYVQWDISTNRVTIDTD